MVHALPAAGQVSSARKLVINLVVEPDGTILVSGCEVFSKEFSNTTSWDAPQRLEQILRPSLAEIVQACLEYAPGAPGHFTYPDCLLETPGLVLSELDGVSQTMAPHSAVRVTLRFKTFLGSLNDVFQPHIDLVSGLLTFNHDVADRIMLDIAMPLLNFLSLDAEGGALAMEDAERLVAQVTEQSHALRFQIELIKRHVSHLEARRKAAAEPPSAMPGAAGFMARIAAGKSVAYVDALAGE